MIVSGFTQRSVEGTTIAMQGSPLDHEHCVACFRRNCTKSPDGVTCCDTVDCPRGCGSRYHGCKEIEHVLVCLEERVPCINSGNGCPMMLTRKHIARHLPSCAASVVFCSFEWHRFPLEHVQFKETRKPLLQKVYANCGQLDLALALRDHRVYVNEQLQSTDARWFPQNSKGFSRQMSTGSSVSIEGKSQGPGQRISGIQDDSNSIENEGEGVRNHRLVQASKETASALTSALNVASGQSDASSSVGENVGETKRFGEYSLYDDTNTRSDHQASEEHGTGETAKMPRFGEYSVYDDHSSSLPTDSGTFSKDEGGDVTATGAFSKDEGGEATATTSAAEATASQDQGSSSAVSEDDLPLGDKWETEIPSGLSLRSVLSMGLNLEWKWGGFYSFMCCQEMKRDEFYHHYDAVHNHIHPGLGGWMEQRCPLAYLGCPFSFRRYGPGVPGTEIQHSWLLESFGMTVSDAGADPLHRTPESLIPAFAETAESVTKEEEGESSAVAKTELEVIKKPNSKSQTSGGNAVSGSAASVDHTNQCLSAAEESSKPRSGNRTVSQAQTLHEGLSEKNNITTTSLSKGKPSSATEKLASANNEPSPSKEECNSSPHKEMSFSALLDNISLDNDQSTMDQSSPPKKSKNEEMEKQTPSESTRVLPESKTEENPETSEKPCFVPRKRTGSGRQDIFSGASAYSCLRVNIVTDKSSSPATSESSSATQSSSSLQLTDLPLEVLYYLTRYLDNFSLCNMSLVCHTLRDVCCGLLQERGMVSFVWAKEHNAKDAPWKVVGKRWKFSTCFASVKNWTFASHNPVSDHLRVCPYNRDRVVHTSRFSAIPLEDTSLSVQIIEMLQRRLKEHREFRGWILRSNFEREHVDRERPHPRNFADVLRGLGGTLPP